MDRYYEKNALRVLIDDLNHYLGKEFNTREVNDLSRLLVLAIKGQITVFDLEGDE